MADGFLGRWSRRKLDVKQGRPLEPEPERQPQPQPALPAAVPAAARGAETPAVHADPPAPVEAPPPTLQEVNGLTPDSDFRRFVAKDTPADVKNAAMKKLFADPHFNVMDGMDVYIDDYSKPDPMPEAMLRSLASADFLGLFREEARENEPGPGANPWGEGPAPQSVAQSRPSGEAPSPGHPSATPSPEVPDADPDLRLQQDHAPGPQGPGHGPR